MCKVAGVAGVTDENRDDVWLLMIALGDLMSRGNNDGIGYAAFDKNDRIFGERWLINNTWFRDLSRDKRIKPTMLQSIYNFFGEKVNRDQAKSIILHTRASTNVVCMENTHPFVDDIDHPTTALIHNGVIWNEDQFKKLFSTCDSEVILTEYLKAKGSHNSLNINDFTQKLEGWFTCLVLAKDPSGMPIVDAFTDNGRLASFWFPKLKVRVYSSEASDIKRAADILGLKTEKQQKMESKTFFRMNANTGEIFQEGELKVMKRGGITHATGNFNDPEFMHNFLHGKIGGGWRGGRRDV